MARGRKGGNPNIGVTQSLLTDIQKKEYRKRIIDYLLKGYSNTQIYSILQPETGLTDDYIYNIIRSARDHIKLTISTDLDEIINYHVRMYEEVYKYFDENDYSVGKLKALFYKEKLLGYHVDNQTIEVNNEVNVEIQKEEDYDLNRLSETEAKRFAQLMKKVKEM